MQLRRHREDLARRVQVLHRLGQVLLVLILAGYWRVQVADGASYRERADHNRLRKLAIEAPRGLILDRHGEPLVENVPSYRLYLDRTRTTDLEASLAQAADVLGVDEAELATQASEAARGLPRFRPVPLAEDLSLTQVSRLAVEHLEHPELEVQVEQLRLYRYAHQTAHLLGYLGEVSEEQLAAQSPQELAPYRPGDLVGRKGLEAQYERRLRGARGERVVVVDSRGRTIEEFARQAAAPGQDLRLTLDLGLQQLASRLLEDKVGAIVALDPRNGAVLAMASSPSFDPNLFSRRIRADEWRSLLEHPKDPLQNRAVHNTYPPGSVFKLVMAAAALDLGKVDPSETVFCRGYSVIFDHRYRCWNRGGHGRVNLRSGLAGSCNVYFHQLGMRLTIDEIAHYARLFGLGEKTGIDLAGERAGLVPDAAWSLRRRGTPWFPGETISVSTGQGPLLVTPLHIAVMTAAVAQGVRVQPHLAADADSALPVPLDLKPGVLDRVRDGMWAVVNDPHGTGRVARLEQTVVAGKTGTAQVVRQETWTENKELAPDQRDHAWFASFAPYDNPRLVVVVFVEHGGGGSTAAAPMARAIYARYFGTDLTHRTR